MSTSITLRHVARRFDGGVYVLRDVNLTIVPGQIVSFIGPSGCGKSTLLRIIAGLDRTHEGTVQVGNRVVHEPGPDVGFMFQEPRLLPWLNVARNIAFGIPAERRGDAKRIVSELLQQVQLPEAGRLYPRQLSGGMMQRVAIARALAGSPGALLLDEPFSALDAFTRIHLQELVLSVLQERGLTALLVTHDIDEALYLSDRVIVLSERPATVDEDIDIGLPRPRDRLDGQLLQLRGHLLEKLRLSGVRRASQVIEPEFVL